MPSLTSPTPKILLNPLPHASGSCTYNLSNTTITTAIHGPHEVRARDELPSTATIEVLIKPATGVAGTRETYLSATLKETLKNLILGEKHPRSLIQVVCQVVECGDGSSIPLLLSPLLNSAVISLLVAGIPLKTTLYSAHLALLPATPTSSESITSRILTNPPPASLLPATSSHTVAYTKEGSLSLIESVDITAGSGGDFAIDEETGEKTTIEYGWTWEEYEAVLEEGRRYCCEEGVRILRESLEGRLL